jgi:hypothetical protein
MTYALACPHCCGNMVVGASGRLCPRWCCSCLRGEWLFKYRIGTFFQAEFVCGMSWRACTDEVLYANALGWADVCTVCISAASMEDEAFVKTRPGP